MKDPRIEKLAKGLLNHSIKLKKGESCLIAADIGAKHLVIELVRQIYKMGAFPFVRLGDDQISREVMMGMTPELSKKMLKNTMPTLEGCDTYISIRYNHNAFELSDVPGDIKVTHTKNYGKPVSDYIHKNIRWVLLNQPTVADAQLAQMSHEAFTDFFYEVCTMDYSKMHKAMIPLKELLEKTDRVRIVDRDTDLTFSIKGQKSHICSGSHNIPDGEVFTSPILKSVNGKIKFNTPSLHKDVMHSDITLEFADGKIINATSSNTKELITEIDSDEGAQFVGEFALGTNPYIKKPMNDTLFDEKIAGSIHLALGKCIEEAPNGNKSQIHWDIVHMGGEIYFDDILIRKDGKFLTKELLPLNATKF